MNAACSEIIQDVRKNPYKEKRCDVKIRIRADKRNMINELTQEAEHEENTNDKCTLYRITKKLCNKKRQSTYGVRDKEGKLIILENQILQRWKEHFDQLLNEIKVKETTLTMSLMKMWQGKSKN
jgi:DNA mismatch repair ATPase MutS